MTREEAIRRIKAWNLDSDNREVLSVVIPELRESEDERMIRILKEGLEGLTVFKYTPVDKIFSWLEKQKDASKAIEAVEKIDKYIDEHLANAHDMRDSNPDKKYYRGWDDALGKMAGILQDVYSDEKQKELKSHLTVKGKGVYKICPHCKSRMIRDDSKVYTSMPPQYGYNCPKCGTMEFDTIWYDNPEMDEQIIDSAPLYTIEQVDEKIREAQEWKPSKEQMEALDKALYYVPEEIGIPIAEIYGHFNKMKKKLM